jgi:hypothetical protein
VLRTSAFAFSNSPSVKVRGPTAVSPVCGVLALVEGLSAADVLVLVWAWVVGDTLVLVVVGAPISDRYTHLTTQAGAFHHWA